VPGDNPFVHTQGAKPEIWHWGLRNPWRWSFDRANGEQWIGDVGQGLYEEVDHVGAGVRGVNFGWNNREGKHAYNGGAMPPGAVDPEIEVPHSNGSCANVGGYVYRGAALAGLGGTYLFSDNCRGQIVAASGGVTHDVGVTISQPSSFGEDSSGELWVLSLSGPVFRLGRAS
jgi:glucose/arabinose dehydrogenase